MVSPEPDVTEHIINEFTRCIVLATDGVRDLLEPIEVVNLADAFVPQLSIFSTPAENVVNAALGKGSIKNIQTDNASAIVVLFS